jgi:hypothetical protein
VSPTPLSDRSGSDYNDDREAPRALDQSLLRHTVACLERKVGAYCDDLPEPGCTCEPRTVEARR